MSSEWQCGQCTVGSGTRPAFSSSTTPAGLAPESCEQAESKSVANFSKASRFFSFFASIASVNEVDTLERTLLQSSLRLACAAES
eukprot:478139-Amphidinium_carterae.1